MEMSTSQQTRVLAPILVQVGYQNAQISFLEQALDQFAGKLASQDESKKLREEVLLRLKDLMQAFSNLNTTHSEFVKGVKEIIEEVKESAKELETDSQDVLLAFSDQIHEIITEESRIWNSLVRTISGKQSTLAKVLTFVQLGKPDRSFDWIEHKIVFLRINKKLDQIRTITERLQAFITGMLVVLEILSQKRMTREETLDLLMDEYEATLDSILLKKHSHETTQGIPLEEAWSR